MKNKRHALFKCLLIFNFVIVGSLAKAQSPNALENLKNVMPPSPNSSAFAKYGDWPVSLYTGVPNITVPVTTLKGRTIDLPITLSYHAAGNKVGDIASWVGLGWSLSAGGVISRSIRGLNDEGGYYHWSSYYSNPDDLSSAVPDNIAQLRVVATANNTADSEQDTYNFSAMGRSYRLLLKADGTVLTIPHSNLKFISNPIVGGGTEWTVLMEDGTKLFFGGDNNYLETNNNPEFQSSDGKGIQFISSWQLRKIITSKGEVVSFTYVFSNIDQDSYFSESDFIKYKSSITVGGPISGCFDVEHSVGTKSVISKQQVATLNLSSMETDVQRVEFISSPDRLDLKGGRFLAQIRVFSKQLNRFTENYNFNTTYSQAVSGNELLNNSLEPSFFYRRLRLTSLERTDINNASLVLQKWSFEYNPQNLPSRRSFAQDHWGYFNGATSNTTLLTRQYFVLPNLSYLDYLRQGTGFMPDKHNLGGNREGHSDFMQAEVLTKIIYPTGGYSQFNFEPNSVPINKEIFTDDQINLDMYLTSGQIPFSSSRSSSFTLSQPGYIGVNLQSQISNNIDIVNLNVSIHIKDSNGTIVASTIKNGVTWFNIINPGTYTFEMGVRIRADDLPTPSHFIDAHASLQYTKSIGFQNVHQLTGGLRVSSIIDFDGVNGATNAKYFQYSNPLIINSVDVIKEYITTQVSSTKAGETGEVCYFLNTIRNSSTKFASGSIQGGTTGYGTVKTLYGPNGENGYSISNFTSEPDDVLSAAPFDPHEFPYPPAVSRDNRRGLLLTQKDFNAQNVILKQVDNSYSFVSKGSVIGYKAGFNELVAPALCLNQYHNCGIIRAYYGNEAEQVQHISSIVTTFDGNGENPLVTSTTNFFDNPTNVQPVRTVTVNSKGQTIMSYSRTALEKTDINSATPLSANASAAIDAMLNMNMVSQPIQQEKWVNTKLANRTTINQKVWFSGTPNPTIVAPEEVVVQTGNSSPETRVQFKSYDALGNLLEQQKASDVLKSYIYDYSFAYPVAEVTNASKEDIAYTSFEADGAGNWALSTVRDNTTGFTGNNSYFISLGISSKPLNPSTSYKVSFWAKNPIGILVNGQSATPGKSSRGWVYYESVISSVTSISITGTSGNIDELRMHPIGAQMTTYTYLPSIGLCQVTDVNSQTMNYEYDSFNRLKCIKDFQGNLVKTFEYNYKVR